MVGRTSVCEQVEVYVWIQDCEAKSRSWNTYPLEWLGMMKIEMLFCQTLSSLEYLVAL